MQKSFIRSTFLVVPVVLLVCSIAYTQTPAPQQEVVAKAGSSTSKPASANVPMFADYRGVKIGMSANDVRSKLDGIKKGDRQDLLNFSEHETAQFYYDAKGNVTAISIDYFGDSAGAPKPEAVLGTTIEAKPDGSMYQLNRYADAGYWVSYNRTAGDKPIVTITMQKM